MPFDGWNNMVPPHSWKRVLAMDVGGATNNAIECGAICPDTQSLVIYAEIVKQTTDIRLLASLTRPLLADETGLEYNFAFRVGDYENRVALDDMGRHGVRFGNAVKHDKNLSIQRMSQYLHPNPQRSFPLWHPKAGQSGAPLLYILPTCKELIKEIPMQKWKIGEGDVVKDEMDRAVRHDTVDCILYICRMLPAPATIPMLKILPKKKELSTQSKMYWEKVRMEKEAQPAHPSRRKYNPNHFTGGSKWRL